MLNRLKINNIALIDESIIEFGSGLNILTGETGAGKSLIIDSLNFVLGARADKSMIKSGSDFAKVEAVFTIDSSLQYITDFFNSINLEVEDTIIISRYLSLQNKNEIRVNGEIVTNAMLKKLTSGLVDLHGQHAHQSLLDTKNHITILDAFAQNDVDKVKSSLLTNIDEHNKIVNKIQSIGGTGADKERNIALLKHQINEIENANLRPNEEDELVRLKNVMLNAEKIFGAINHSSISLIDGEYNATSAIKIALNNLNFIKEYDDEINSLYTNLESHYYEVVDIADRISSLKEKYTYSETELNNIEERLDVIKSLKRKYGSDINEVLASLEKAKESLEEIENGEERLKNLLAEKTIILYKIYDDCKMLTTLRKKVASNVESNIILQLKDLGMKHSKFCVSFNNEYTIDNIEEKFTLNGADNVEFMFSANVGEEAKSLSKIISGGEMSRFMLAIKCVINSEPNKVMIFDEIDNGIGGLVAYMIAEKLSIISQKNQVICVTHLAQIASYADSHFFIKKSVKDDKTFTSVEKLEDDKIVLEITRLMGANVDSPVALQHSGEILSKAKKFKFRF